MPKRSRHRPSSFAQPPVFPRSGLRRSCYFTEA